MRTAFRSLSVPNFRRYYTGLAVSAPGSWMQTVAEAWLVLQITGSGVALGVVSALQFGPMLIGGAWGGVLADRVDKRRLLLVTQAIKAGLALVLGVLAASGRAEIWMIYVIATSEGLVNVADNTARRSFVMELVGREHVANAVSLTGALWTTARIVGPAIAGLLIAGVGIAPCFFINAASYIGVLIGLYRLRPADLHREALVPRAPGQVREGLRHVMGDPRLRGPLLLMAVAGILAYNFRVVLPLVATDVFGQGAGAFGFLYSAMSVGALGGALFTASRHQVGSRFPIWACLAFGGLIVLTSAAPTLVLFGAALVAVGAASASFSSTTQASLQLQSPAHMRGRIMAIYSVVFLGTTPLGSPLVGWLAELIGPRVTFGLCGAVTAGAAGVSLVAGRGRRAESVETDALEEANVGSEVAA